MKRVVAIAASILTVMGSGVVSVPAAQAASLLGDVNQDGAVNITDVYLLSSYLCGEYDTAFADWEAVDLSQDGKLNAKDLTLLKRLLLNGRPDETDPRLRLPEKHQIPVPVFYTDIGGAAAVNGENDIRSRTEE